jgi:GntR family transcriptional regulator
VTAAPWALARPETPDGGRDRAGQDAGYCARKAPPTGLSEKRLSRWPWTVFKLGPANRKCRAAAGPEGAHGTTITSTMLDVNIDRSERLPLHDQVAAQIRRAIADGEAGPGQRLPLAKDLAAVLGVNKNTILRALRILRAEGLLEFRRGRGITVAASPERGAVLAQVRSVLEYARHHGYGRKEIIKIINDLPEDCS